MQAGDMIQLGLLVCTGVGIIIGGTNYIAAIKEHVLKEIGMTSKRLEEDTKSLHMDTSKSFAEIRETFWRRADATEERMSKRIIDIAANEADRRHDLRNEMTGVVAKLENSVKDFSNKLESKIDKILDNQTSMQTQTAMLAADVTNIKSNK